MYRIFVKKAIQMVKLVDTKSTSYFHTPHSKPSKIYLYRREYLPPKPRNMSAGMIQKEENLFGDKQRINLNEADADTSASTQHKADPILI